MARTTIPSENCVFRLNYKNGYQNATNLPVTYSNVGLADNGFTFNGTNSYIDIGKPANLAKIYNTISIFILYKPTNISGNQFLFDIGTDAIGLRTFIVVNSNGINNIGVQGVGTTSYNSGSTVFGWHNIGFVFTKNIVNTGLQVYYDGINIANTTTTNTSLNLITSSTGKIGTRFNIASGYFNGTIKSVAIYNKALTAQEVADLYSMETFKVV